MCETWRGGVHELAAAGNREREKALWAQNQEVPLSWPHLPGSLTWAQCQWTPWGTVGGPSTGGPPRAAVGKAPGVSRAGVRGEITGLGRSSLGGPEGGCGQSEDLDSPAVQELIPFLLGSKSRQKEVVGNDQLLSSYNHKC